MAGHDEAQQLALETLNTMPPAEQFLSPLDYIFADHFRQRTLCAMLDRIATEESVDRKAVATVLRFMRGDFGLHVLDEEEDLFPLLRRRTEPEDRIEDILAELCQEHDADRKDASDIVEGLEAIEESGAHRPPTSAFRRLLQRFAANERRHLTVENAIVMPLARARLNADDLRNLGRRMAARRGHDYPGTVHAV
jgi:hemerythrin-like domain-containing protein